MRWKLLPFLLLVPASAQAQLSGCVRDANGALQCTLQRPPISRSVVNPTRSVPRVNLGAEALQRSQALAQQRREAAEQQQPDPNEDRVRARRECLGRAAADDAGKPACGF